MQNPFDSLNKKLQDQNQGLSKRDYIATIAMQGLVSNPTNGEISIPHITALSVRFADSLIEELAK